MTTLTLLGGYETCCHLPMADGRALDGRPLDVPIGMEETVCYCHHFFTLVMFEIRSLLIV